MIVLFGLALVFIGFYAFTDGNKALTVSSSVKYAVLLRLLIVASIFRQPIWLLPRALG